MNETEFIVQATFVSPDDKAFQKHRERKRALKIVLPPIPNGPCCARCRNWKPPEAHDEFGLCRLLAVVTERAKYGPERGTIVGVHQAVKQIDWAWDYLPIRGFAEPCSLYRSEEPT